MLEESDDSQLSERLNAWVGECVILRFGREDEEVTLPPVTATPQEVLNSLIEVRKRLDRVHEIMAQSTRLKSRAIRNKFAAKYEAEDAWDHALEKQRMQSVRRNSSEFEGPKERYSKANLESFKEQRTARQAEVLASKVEEADEVIRQCHWGLDTLRQDHLTMLRTLGFESTLER